MFETHLSQSASIAPCLDIARAQLGWIRAFPMSLEGLQSIQWLSSGFESWLDKTRFKADINSPQSSRSLSSLESSTSLGLAGYTS